MRHIEEMRTTLAIDDDVLKAAKAIARQQGMTIGAVVSSLARNALRLPVAKKYRGDVPLIPTRDKNAIITLELVNALRDEGI